MRTDRTAQSTWDELAAAAAAVRDEDAGAVTALGIVVQDLESAAGAPRWPVDHEPLIVLQRRFAHAQRRLDVTVLNVPRLQEHLSALRGATVGPGQPVTAVVAHAAVRAAPVPC